MPSPCTVTGTLATLTSGKIAQGQILFQLVNIGTGNPISVTGTSIFPSLTTVVMTAQDGTFSTQLWGNDNINPANTLYSVTFRDYLRNEIGPILYSIIGTSANLNSLAAQSTTVPPVFVTGIVTPGSLAFTNLNQSTSFSIITLAAMYRVTTGSSAITVTLPGSVGLIGQTVIIKKIDSGTGTVIISGGTIDGLSSFTLSAQGQYIGLQNSGTAAWDIWTRN